MEIKAKLLCEGINPDAAAIELFRRQNPSNAKRGGLSSGGKMRLECESGLFVNAPFYTKKKVDLKAVSLRLRARRVYIEQMGEYLCSAEILPAPEWYEQKVGRFGITQILTAHNRQLAAAVYEDCALFAKKEQCSFCVINRSLQDKDPELVNKKAELLVSAMRKIPLEDYGGLTLNGGMTMRPGRGMEIVEPVVREVSRAYPGFQIAVEMAPPADLGWIDRLVDAGATGLMMNLETWDESIRARLIPGKNRYCPKESYLAAFERAVKLLGKGRVSTCFVVGTEPVESLMQGIREVIGLRVVPSPIAGRYFEDIPGYPFKPKLDWREFLDVIRFAQAESIRQGLRSLDKAGCVACGMCDMIKDFVG